MNHFEECEFQKLGNYCNCQDLNDDLVKKLIVIPIWRWKEGILVLNKDRQVRISVSAPQESFWLTEGWLPILSDSGTGGFLFWLLSCYCKAQVACQDLKSWECKTSFGVTTGDSLGQACAKMLVLINSPHPPK